MIISMDSPVRDSATLQYPLSRMLSSVSMSGGTMQSCSVEQQGVLLLHAASARTTTGNESRCSRGRGSRVMLLQNKKENYDERI